MPYKDEHVRRQAHRTSEIRRSSAEQVDPVSARRYQTSLGNLADVIRTRPAADALKGIALTAVDLAAAHPVEDLRGQAQALKIASDALGKINSTRAGKEQPDRKTKADIVALNRLPAG